KGGGIFADAGTTLTITKSLISGNTASGGAGGSGLLTADASAPMIGGAGGAASGGGICNAGALDTQTSSITRNVVSGGAGGFGARGAAGALGDTGAPGD